jgi:hypothetical protein
METDVLDVRCYGAPCEYDTDTYDNGHVHCRNCGVSALVGCTCGPLSDTGECKPCHYVLDGGGYLSDTDKPRTMHCRHCGRVAWISR